MGKTSNKEVKQKYLFSQCVEISRDRDIEIQRKICDHHTDGQAEEVKRRQTSVLSPGTGRTMPREGSTSAAGERKFLQKHLETRQ